ncbi:MAG: hydantoinase B/oxoprolinase family protein, partial [Myxococcales bacterium]|nr:hydantoinase B/oxoprolinase family protein [Myxococcales bacterium]
LDSSGVLVLTDEREEAQAGDRVYGAYGDAAHADPVRLEVLGNRFMSIAERMGSVLRNTSVSTNIKERLDYSCAVFDAKGGLIANAPHIPVHLGAMGETVRSVLEEFPQLAGDDVIVTNDPSRGGSHLPDVTVVAPVFDEEALRFFVAARGHHADLGGKTPGSMPADSVRLEEEGVVLHPFPVVRGGVFDEARLRAVLAAGPYPARNPDDNVADLEAMIAATRAGGQLLRGLLREAGRPVVEATMAQLQEAAGRKVALEIRRLGDGRHTFADRLDDGTPIRVALEVSGDRMRIDFTGTGAVHPSNLNAPRAVVQSAVIYVLRSLVADRIPLNGGCLQPVEIVLPHPSILDPPEGAAVVGGNVETSQRIVDVLLGAVGRVAASQGTMNNVTFGNDRFGYYETIGGGAGASRDVDGASGVHTHMTNTRITDPEVIETRYPVVLEEFSIRRGSGGAGKRRGGDGLNRVYRFLASVTVSLLGERRETAPYGLEGGEPGARGENVVQRAGGAPARVSGRATLELGAGDRLRIATPGGGGYGRP